MEANVSSSSQILGVYANFASRHITLENVTIRDASGSAIAGYLTSDLDVVHSKILDTFNASGRTSGTTEFGAVSGLLLSDDVFANYYSNHAQYGESKYAAPVVLDEGTEFFSIQGCTFDGARNIGLSMVTGVHNGSITGNSFGYIAGSSPGDAINGVGIRDVYIAGNTAVGGSGFAVDLESAKTYSVNITSAGNYVNPHGMSGFASGEYRRSTASRLDTYVQNNQLGPIVGGSASEGLQIQWGNTGAIFDSTGTTYSGANLYSAFNAYQSSYRHDQWTQKYARAGSFLQTYSATQSCYYYARPGTASAQFRSFWGSPIACIDSSGNLSAHQLKASVYSGTQSATIIPLPGAGNGSTATCDTVDGFDCTQSAGVVRLTFGSRPAPNSDWVQVSWPIVYPHTAVCEVQDINATANNVSIRDGYSAKGLKFGGVGSIPDAGSTLRIAYQCSN